MVIISRNNISQSKATSNDFVRYHLPKALLSSPDFCNEEPSCYSDVVKSPYWCATMNYKFDVFYAIKHGP
jgi:hypothetical protein